jgi:hypothetical protein
MGGPCLPRTRAGSGGVLIGARDRVPTQGGGDPSRAGAGRGSGPATRGRPGERRDPAPLPAKADDYLARLAKHVPGEVLAIFLLLAALLDDEPFGWRVAAVVFGVLRPWLWIASNEDKPTNRCVYTG